MGITSYGENRTYERPHGMPTLGQTEIAYLRKIKAVFLRGLVVEATGLMVATHQFRAS